MLQKQGGCAEESQHQPETAAQAAPHKYFDGSRVVDAAGEADGGGVRGGRGAEEQGRH